MRMQTLYWAVFLLATCGIHLQVHAGEVRTYQFVASEDRPFRIYGETGLTGRAKLSGSFDVELDHTTATGRLIQINAQLIEPTWAQLSTPYTNETLPPYLVGELDHQSFNEVWPNDLTRLNGELLDDHTLEIRGPGGAFIDWTYPVVEFPHDAYFTALTIKFDANLAGLSGSATFRGDDGGEYSLTNAVAILLTPEPSTFIAAIVGLVLMCGLPRRKQRNRDTA